MTELHGRIPHALKKSHEDLVAELDTGIKQFGANGRYSNSHDVCRCIERFVDAFYQIPGAKEELKRRASLVELLCGIDSEYVAARKQSQSSYRGQPRKRTGSKIALVALRNSEGNPLFVASLDRERVYLERILDDGVLRLGDTARTAFNSWRSACRAVQRKVDGLEVDGCWYLLYIHQAAEDSPAKRSRLAKAVTKSTLGHAPLEWLLAASNSLFDWSVEFSKATARTNTGGRKIGRKPGARLSKAERDCISMYEVGKKQQEIDREMLRRNGAKRGVGEKAKSWGYGDADRVIRAARKRGEIPSTVTK